MPRKLTTEEFIRRAKEKHGDKYDYSKVEYKDNKTKVTITCPKHGDFEQTPNTHLSGKGCPKCSGNVKMNTASFVDRAKKVHGDKYDYSKVVYKNNSTKVIITCSEHGNFEKTPAHHLRGQGCPKCSSAKLDTASFIAKAKEVHGDKYDYSKVVYKSSHKKVIITCLIHGDFEQSPTNHLRGRGCPKCSDRAKLDTASFVDRAKKAHGNKYNYSKTVYKNVMTNVIITCPVHGDFEQRPTHHIKGQGCPKCSGNAKMNTEEFIDRAKKAHGNKYNYSKTVYKNAKTNVTITCPVHGDFEQRPTHHLKATGCPKCNRGWEKHHIIELLDSVSYSDLLHFGPDQLYAILTQAKGAFPQGLLDHIMRTPGGSPEREQALQEMRERYEQGQEDEEADLDLAEEDDIEVLPQSEGGLMSEENVLSQALWMDDKRFTSLDDAEAIQALFQLSLHRMWDQTLKGNDSFVQRLRKADTTHEIAKLYDDIRPGTTPKDDFPFFRKVREQYLTEYDWCQAYQPPQGYSFPYRPNLMQKLVVHRLMHNGAYGNWSGTGAGKTLSMILASREADARLTVVVVVNSTKDEMSRVIREVYPDSMVYDSHKRGVVYHRECHNYVLINYEKLQQDNSPAIMRDLVESNQVDFLAVDEVHKVKQRGSDDSDESRRRAVLLGALVQARETNPELKVLVMSATPVINNLKEGYSLLELIKDEKSSADTRASIPNAMALYQELMLHGLRYVHPTDQKLVYASQEDVTIKGTDELVDRLVDVVENESNTGSRSAEMDRVLIDAKLEKTGQYLRKGVVVYSHFRTGIFPKLRKLCRVKGLSFGEYTGENTATREQDLRRFVAGELDVLLASQAVTTGVDGLQKVCDRMIIVIPPWTAAEYEQLIGRVYRQGSNFKQVEIIEPLVSFDDRRLCWDERRQNKLRYKRDLADIAVSGNIPKKALPPMNVLLHKTQEALKEWKQRIKEEGPFERQKRYITSMLSQVETDEQRRERVQSIINEEHRLASSSKSSTTNKRYRENPDLWHRYHAMRQENVREWDEKPTDYIGTKLYAEDVVLDMGCGMRDLAKTLPQNKIISVDHVACDESVIAADCADLSVVVEDGSVDTVVLSLALWGKNWTDYLKEAYRVLSRRGYVYIAEPNDNIDKKRVVEGVQQQGFEMVGQPEVRGRFTYLSFIKC